MSDKKTQANIFLLLRQVESQTIQKNILPSKILQQYDQGKKGYLTFQEFQEMFQTMLDSQYKNAIKDVWDFIIDRFKPLCYITGEMLNKTIQQVCLIDKQYPSQTKQLQSNQFPNNSMQPGANQPNGWNQNQQQNQQQNQNQNQNRQPNQQIFQSPNYIPQQQQNQYQNQQQYQQSYQQQPYQQPQHQNQYQQSQQQNQQPQYQNQQPYQNAQQQQQQQNQNQYQQPMKPQNDQYNKQNNNNSPMLTPKHQPQQLQKPLRSPQQVFKIITKTIQVNESTMKEMFSLFDQDQDKYLNINELRGFCFNQVSQLTEDEFNQVVITLNGGSNNISKIKVSLFQLMKQTQDSTAMMNSIKMENPVVKPQKPQKAKQDIFAQIAIPQAKGLLESNIYENQANPNLLTSKIDFQEYFVIDHNTPGLQKFVQTFGQLKQMGQLFQDQKFPANQTSLGGRLNSKVQAWKRPKDIWPNQNYQFFVKDTANTRVGLGKWISPSDINQGELGDCYFLASVSSIACRRPDAILDLFVTRKLNPCGMYCVRINIDGQWTAVTVDDMFPAKNNRPVFTQSKDRELWVMVLEKAWAKIFGSYQNIEAGVAREVMRALTGAPTKVFMTSDATFLEELEKCCQQKCIMVSGSYSIGYETGITQTIVNRTGLVPGHAYSILKIKEVVHPKQGKVKLVKLRNPWAEKEWLGDWSDQSPLWTPDIKKQLNYVASNEGVFYMDVSSLIQHFSDVQVCYLRPNYCYRSEQIISTKKNSVYFALLIDVAGEYFITVTQRNKRFKDGIGYSPARIVIGEKIQNGKYILVASCNKHADQEIYCTGQFKVGVYMVQVKVNWQHNDENTFTLSSYGKGKVGLNQVQKTPQFIRSIYMDQAQKNQAKKHYDGEPKLAKCYEFSIDLGYGYFYVDNQSRKQLESTVNFQGSSGIKVCKPDRGQAIKISLSPGQSHLSVFSIQPKGYSYTFKESLTLRQV